MFSLKKLNILFKLSHLIVAWMLIMVLEASALHGSSVVVLGGGVVWIRAKLTHRRWSGRMRLDKRLLMVGLAMDWDPARADRGVVDVTETAASVGRLGRALRASHDPKVPVQGPHRVGRPSASATTEGRRALFWRVSVAVWDWLLA